MNSGVDDSKTNRERFLILAHDTLSDKMSPSEREVSLNYLVGFKESWAILENCSEKETLSYTC